ncbi:F-box protein cpr30 [Phtheirospermum japonicum]|uniref:F-box protein cpr30 n=1 Tax=Phtheirospermum japonicum TaxID=374723 RepID=A0A830B9W7_9LAMI|nr:F-box protein cpr30 [Phtheirospermum japonicum]
MVTLTDNVASHVPVDIIISILSRLPVKSLVRFRTVSESWNATISDPRFTRLHLEQSKASDSDILFVQRSSTPCEERFISSVRFENQKSQFPVNLEIAFGGSTVLCTCEGVMLIKTDSSNTTYTLWNPSTRTKTTLWCPNMFPFYNSTGNGLCYDPSSDDFKVIFINNWGYYAVYSCKNKYWIVKEKEFPYSDFRGLGTSSSGVFVNGSVYWVANNREIIYFDPTDDEFKTLCKPEHMEENDLFYLVCLRGRLCLYCDARSDHGTVVQIWVKEKGKDEDSWEGLMTIENVMRRPIGSFEPLFFVRNKILIRLDGAKLVVYCPCEETFEELVEDISVFGSLVPCVKSLLFPTQSLRPKRKRYHLRELYAIEGSDILVGTTRVY